MAGARGSLHEGLDVLKPETVDRHRAIVSLMGIPVAVAF